MEIRKITELFFLLTIFSLPLYRWHFMAFFVPTNIPEVLAVFSLALLVFQKKRDFSGELLAVIRTFHIPVALIFLGLLSSFLVNDWTSHGLGIIKGWFVVPFLFSMSLPLIFNNEKKILWVLQALYSSIFLVGIISLGYKSLGLLTYDHRLAGFYLSPNHLAMFLSLGFFIFPFLLEKTCGAFHKNLLRFSFLAIALSLYFTLSYGSWLAILSSLVLLFVIRWGYLKKSILLFGSLFILCLVFFAFQLDKPKLTDITDSRSSLSSRIMIWRSASKIIGDNPIFGIGPGNFQVQYLQYQKYYPPYLEWSVPEPHNLYLAFYLQTGLVGLMGFLLLCYKWLRLTLKQRDTGFTAVSLGILFYTLFLGLVDTPYWKNDLAFSFWIILGLTTAFANLPKFAQKSSL